MTINNSNEMADVAPPEELNARRANLVDLHVGARVRVRRTLMGMSQEKLGESLGLTFQQVQKYEKGTNRIGASRLFALAQVLGVPIQYFYDELNTNHSAPMTASGFSERPSETYVVEFLASREGVDLNKSFVKITDPKVRRAVIELVRSLANADGAEAESQSNPGFAQAER
jgi:transcriptional regulator with XRE-family HTH domain